MTLSAQTATVGLAGIAALHQSELPQKDNLCGCFWGAIVLKAAGAEEEEAEPLDQDRVAREAGTTLPAGDPQTFVPSGESPRRDYRLELPLAADPDASGTSARGLARAVERLSGARLVVVPVAGPWEADTVADLVEATADAAPGTTLLANVRTGRLWGSRPHPSALLSHLAGAEVEGPPAEWDVGHFVNLAGVVRGAAAALVVVRDSYRGLGWDGYHLQPASALAQALERGDGREGGVLCVVPTAGEAALRSGLAHEGFELRHWANGTPDPGPAAE